MDRAMTEEQVRGTAEAILFASGQPQRAEEMAKAIGCTVEEMTAALAALQQEYAADGRGISLMRLEDAWQMCTKKAYYPALIALSLNPRKPHLTDVQLETLSVIAYRQPVTKAEIERIRGVNSDHAVNKLISYDLVCELGRAKTPGKPALFGTTEEFLRCFDLSSKDDLPDMNPVKLEDFREEAEKEAEKIGI